MEKEFREIEGFPDYQVTNTGEVWSRKLYGSPIGGIGPWWKMKPKKGKGKTHKYFYVDLFREVGKPERRMIHWLVLEAFVGPRLKGKWGLHKDDNPENNNLDNLYWGSRSQNYDDALKNGRASVGENRYNAVLTNKGVLEIRRMAKEGIPYKVIGEKFKKTAHYIARICCREIWKHV